jgi:biopolymer transport protein ExbD
MALSGPSEVGGSSIIADINITPLTDVMLVLLIIFMVTATFFVTEPAMKVNLPPAVTSEREPEEGGEITVIVNRAGVLFVDNRQVRPADLVQALMAAARRIPNERKVVVVRGDRDDAYGAVIWVMDAARLVGLRYVSLATEEPAGGAPSASSSQRRSEAGKR